MKMIVKTSAILLGVTLLFAACSKSSDPAANNNNNTATIVGIWTETKSSITNCTNAGSNVPEASCGSSCWTLTLGSDNSVISSTVVNAGSPTILTGTYSVSGNQLSISYAANGMLGGYTASYTFALTINSLVLLRETAAYPGCQFNYTLTKP